MITTLEELEKFLNDQMWDIEISRENEKLIVKKPNNKKNESCTFYLNDYRNPKEDDYCPSWFKGHICLVISYMLFDGDNSHGCSMPRASDNEEIHSVLVDFITNNLKPKKKEGEQLRLFD